MKALVASKIAVALALVVTPALGNDRLDWVCLPELIPPTQWFRVAQEPVRVTAYPADMVVDMCFGSKTPESVKSRWRGIHYAACTGWNGDEQKWDIWVRDDLTVDQLFCVLRHENAHTIHIDEGRVGYWDHGCDPIQDHAAIGGVC